MTLKARWKLTLATGAMQIELRVLTKEIYPTEQTQTLWISVNRNYVVRFRTFTLSAAEGLASVT